MKLLSHLSPDGNELPLPADQRRLALGREAWSLALAEASHAAVAARAWSATPIGERLLAAIFGNSPFLSGVAVGEWEFLTHLVTDGADPVLDELLAAIEQHPDPGEARPALMRRLRIAKRRLLLLAAVAELTQAWALERQTYALSRFAAAALGTTLRHLLRSAAAEGTITLGNAADPERDCGIIVLGMGKLGGGELNYSSDIDLILLYDTARAATPAQGATQRFYVRLTQELVRIFDERTADGYAFRTDLRLRPDPRSTPLALSTAAALVYYESVGQNWERAALIKARPVAGDTEAAARFLAELQPFIWRKNLDFAAIQDIHSIKRQIDAHHRGGRIAVEGHNIKTGRGGIREIEFFAQTQQLIWGGRRRDLRVAATCTALRHLAADGRIDDAAAETLIEDYRFLRRLEHRLQMVDDAQTHTLPSDPAGIAVIATFLGYREPAEFVADLLAHLASVERHYAELFEEAPSLAGPGNLVFTGVEDDNDTLATITALGFADAHAVAGFVRGWHHGRLRAMRSQRAREIVTELVPVLLRVFGATAHPDTALLRFNDFLSRLAAGVQLLSLFQANPNLLALVAEIMAEAPHLADNLARRPALLDAVLTADFFAPIPDRAGLAADLADVLSGARDYQDILDGVRRWADERRFQVGVRLLRRGLDGLAAGAALADIAETAIAALLPAVTADFARLHGSVPGGALAVIGMGRLGSREMSLASDLDLILIYEAVSATGLSDGARPLPASAYYARLGQRLIGAITVPTGEGTLYAVDMRLRPSGEAGPIASSLDAFIRYQREAAWTWEHMALTRARPVAGDPALCQRLEMAIAAILQIPRDRHRLVADVADMRRRLAAQHPRPPAWDLRNRPGGLIDLDFTIQYLMLREAAGTPAVLARDTAAAIAALRQAGMLAPRIAGQLAEAYRLLRHLHTLLSLLAAEEAPPPALSDLEAATLARCAGAVDFARLDADMTAATARVHACYERLVALAGTPRCIPDRDQRGVPMSVNIGDKAPDFTLPTDGNGTVSLGKLTGKPVVLYFYPKDDTSGCTAQACGFRDALPDYTATGAVVIGVSKDSVASHDKFKKKHELPFILASDHEGKVCDDYGVWIEKSMYGRKYMGIDRSTFLIDNTGVVRGIWHKVKVPGHVAEVLKAAREL